jgi:bacterioferritin (cytochrome b1)
MEHSFDFLVQKLLDIDLRAERETMERYLETILRAEYAAELVRSAKLKDIIIAQEQRRETAVKNAFGLV